MAGAGKNTLYWINYAWRLFATGLSFTVFGIGGFCLGAFIMPSFSLFIKNQEKKHHYCQKTLHRSFYIFIGMMHHLGIMTHEINGLEKLNRPGQLIIANHPTLIDIVFLISRIPVACCIVKNSLLNNPFMKRAIMNAGYIPNADPQRMIDDCIAYLRAGGVMIIFPEGTRTVPNQPYNFQRGAAAIALQANTIVTPVTMSCYPSTLTKAEKWYQIPHRPFHLAMHVGDDIDLSRFLTNHTRTIAVRRFNKYLLDYFTQQQELYEQYGK